MDKNLNSSEKSLLLVLSILISMGIWLFVSSSTNPNFERTFRGVPVIYEMGSSSDTRTLVGSYPDKIDISVFGKRNDLISMNQDEIKVSLDLSSASLGTKEYVPKVELPRTNMSVNKLSQEAIELTIDELHKRKYTVKFDEIGKLPENMHVRYTPANAEVELSGAKSELAKVKEVVAVINLSDLKEDLSKEYKLEIVANEGESSKPEVHLSAERIPIKVEIRKQKEIDIKYSIAKSVEAPLEILKTELKNGRLLFEGKEELIDKISEINTKPLDLSKIKEAGKSRQTLQPILDEGISLVGAELPILVLDIDKKEKIKVDLSETNIKIDNLLPNLDAEVLNSDWVNVYLEAYSREFKDFSSKNLDFRVDAANLTEGNYAVPIICTNLPEGIKISDQSEKLELRIIKQNE